MAIIFLLFVSPSLSQDIAAYDDYFGTEPFLPRKTIYVLSNDKAAKDATLSIVSYTNQTAMVSPPVVNNQAIDIFTPLGFGHDRIVYRICDGTGCDTATLHIGIYIAFAPIAINDVFVVDAPGVLGMQVLKNDLRANASQLTIVEPPSCGDAVVEGSKINYTPYNLSFTVDTLAYEVCKNGECSSAMVFIHCYNPNKKPILTNFNIDLDEDGLWRFSDSQFDAAFNDPDDGDQLTRVKIVSAPSCGALILGQDTLAANRELSVDEINRLIYAPPADFSGLDSLVWNASDGAAYAIAPAKVRIQVRPVNDPPVANDDLGLTMLEDSTIAVYPLENDYDVENDPLKIVSASSAHAAIEVHDDSLVVRPAPDFFGMLTISYQISDGTAFAQATIEIEVVGVDDAPAITDLYIELEEDGEYRFTRGDFENVFSDPEDDGLDGIAILSLPDNGALELNQKAAPLDKVFAPDTVELVFSPAPDFHGKTFFEWKAFAGQNSSNVARAHIQVAPVWEKLTVYEGFSPNGDRFNDKWIIDGIEDYPDNEVKIFNRAGLLVFAIKNYNNETKVWSGETNVYHFNAEKLAPEDVYYYIIQLKEGKSIKGSVALKR